jgi:hypothetical protein
MITTWLPQGRNVDICQRMARFGRKCAHLSCVRTRKSLPLHCNREIVVIFIRLVVNRFKVKIMLLDFQTTTMLVSVAVATVLSVFTLVHTDIE